MTMNPDVQNRLQVRETLSSLSNQLTRQAEVQRELERREWAEPGDNVMAEYITVLLANGNSRDRVHAEMDDLVGSDFDPAFLEWLFRTSDDLSAAPPPPVARRDSPPPRRSQSPPPREPQAQRQERYDRNDRPSRLLDSALGGLNDNKRKADFDRDAKRRVSDGPPSGPRAGNGGRSLQDRIGARMPGPGGPGMQVRGMAGPGQGHGPRQQNNMGGFRNGPQGGMNGGMGMPTPFGFFQPGQQEMMAQMMMMQAGMAQMSEMMQKMVEERDEAEAAKVVVEPPKPIPAKVPHGTKLGAHSVSAITPKSSSAGPIPTKPTSTALCRYGVGCSNSRCTYSHPSPVANEHTGMVLSEEACEAGKACKDPECIKSHVSPAAVLGETAGPSRLLCKYQNCTNPSCPFRHEDAQGNSVPPPALTAAKLAREREAQRQASQNSDNDGEDGDVEVVMNSKGLMDGALDDSRPTVQCRYAERCTRPDCKFSHPPSRPQPKNKFKGHYVKPSAIAAANGVGGGTGYVSKKFGAAAAVSEAPKPKEEVAS